MVLLLELPMYAQLILEALLTIWVTLLSGCWVSSPLPDHFQQCLPLLALCQAGSPLAQGNSVSSPPQLSSFVHIQPAQITPPILGYANWHR